MNHDSPLLPALTPARVESIYNRYGIRQDRHAFYEEEPIDCLLRHAEFERARSVFEFGCGTGWFARRLLHDFLPPESRFSAVDLSPAMVAITASRLVRWKERAKVERIPPDGPISEEDRSFDRFVSNYVLDILSARAIHLLLEEAHRILTPGGLLCLISLTSGTGVACRLASTIWKLVYRMDPGLLGGCRPLPLLPFLNEREWKVRYRRVVSVYGLASEVVIAERSSA